MQLVEYETKATSGKKDKRLHPLDIDAYWIQRKLSKYYKDSITSQARAKDVVEILQTAQDDRDFENRLVLLLGVDCFEFIKILKKHRFMSKSSQILLCIMMIMRLLYILALYFLVLYCTLLATAQTEKEKLYIKDKMRQDADLTKILSQIETGESIEDPSGNSTMSTRDSAKAGAIPGSNISGQVEIKFYYRI